MKVLEYILAALLSSYAIYSATNWYTQSVTGKVFMVLSILLLIIICFNAIKQKNKEDQDEKINSVIGNIKSNDSHNGIIDLFIGDNGNTRFRLGSGGFISDGDDPIFKLSIENNKLELYALIRDPHGKVAAVIEKNVWTCFNNEYNNDTNAFEIVTAGERKVYFQIEYKNGCAHFRGALVNSKGTGGMFWIDDNGSARGIQLVNNSFNINIDLKSKVIFKYPRQKYLGVRKN